MGRVAGIDYGTVRIGIAMSDPDRILSSPYETYPRKSEKADAEYFQRLVREEQVVQFVVGLPVHLSGEASEKSKEAMAFADWLKRQTGVPVDFVDERFTSVEAERYLRGAKLTNKKRKDRRDKIAAQILLATYLESGPIQPETIGGIE
ncbi:MAG: Holliday junction resolvase RuvX [Planctomycetaceae bacterium]|nr:Holliday junction resolvase RuvX [Planctomycetaceae bacterium]